VRRISRRSLPRRRASSHCRRMPMWTPSSSGRRPRWARAARPW